MLWPGFFPFLHPPHEYFEKIVLIDRAVGHNPFRVVIDRTHDPRVARPSQPWALLRNPFGIRRRRRFWKCQIAWRCFTKGQVRHTRIQETGIVEADDKHGAPHGAGAAARSWVQSEMFREFLLPVERAVIKRDRLTRSLAGTSIN